ncbi:hypothetical protein BDV96DRAFT_643883 [Lophiotrema nucula]|uniref:3'(2'),5'-bisphosphate nucleotidase n=1 Tax=Lophiotrema nucula TaxID=690887 RepID=A0A6A5ZDC6_9PLEO|nr:hypothetical protein BDV96DRAFT_643883 [Lophiotrema nucula]
MPTPFSDELSLALRTVYAASRLTKDVLRSLNNNVSGIAKADDSPVTIADFAAQALIIGAVQAVYPDDAFVGEESSKQLRENDALAERVWQLVQRASTLEEADASQMSDVQHVQAYENSTTSQTSSGSLSFPRSKAEMLDLIDLGQTSQLREGRVWVLDPVDGTATFMKGQQYAVALCLVLDGEQQVGVIGCPNLHVDFDSEFVGMKIHEDLVDEAEYGVVLSAVQGQGTYIRAMEPKGLGEPRPISHTQGYTSRDLSTLNFVESAVGATSLSQEEHRLVAESLGATPWPGTTIWSQQMKYVSLVLGASDVHLRIPKTKDRFTMVWDHAGGHLLFTEAGGTIKDFDGKPIDFGQGRYLKGDTNYGMVCAAPWCFDTVMKAVKDVLDQRTR